MTILDIAIEHFESKSIIEIEVPEWIDDETKKPVVLFSTPFTLAEKKKIYKFAKEDDLEFVVRVVIMKAMNKQGDRVFDLSDKQKFMHRVSPDVVTRIAQAMSESETVEEQVGN